jgi:hypothetical protein
MGHAGPQGTGMIPPGAEQPTNTGPVDDTQEEQVPQTEELPSDDEIDAVPPVEDDTPEPESDDDVTEPVAEEDEDDDRLNQALTALEDRVQKRFDRAVSRITRRLEDRLQDDDDDDDDEEDDEEQDDEEKKPRRAKRRQPQRRPVPVDRRSVTLVRSLARDTINDEMDRSGAQERKAVKAIVDHVLQVVDLKQVDDEQEFVEDLVTKVRDQVTGMVKVGSDRKVAHLRQMGLLAQRQGQPATRRQADNGSPTTAMAKGARRAQARWPGGTRSLSGRKT